MLAAQLFARHTDMHFPQKTNDPFFGKSLFTRPPSVSSTLRPGSDSKPPRYSDVGGVGRAQESRSPIGLIIDAVAGAN